MGPQNQQPFQYRPWRIWLIALLLAPPAAASGAMLYALYLQVSTGRMIAGGKSYGSSWRTIHFVESPVGFVFFVVLQAALAAGITAITIVIARLVIAQIRTHRQRIDAPDGA